VPEEETEHVDRWDAGDIVRLKTGGPVVVVSKSNPPPRDRVDSGLCKLCRTPFLSHPPRVGNNLCCPDGGGVYTPYSEEAKKPNNKPKLSDICVCGHDLHKGPCKCGCVTALRRGRGRRASRDGIAKALAQTRSSVAQLRRGTLVRALSPEELLALSVLEEVVTVLDEGAQRRKAGGGDGEIPPKKE
jgi:hypothetical protein